MPKRKKSLDAYILNKFSIEWCKDKIGFGRFCFYNDMKHNLHIDNEYMGKCFLKKIMNHLIDKAILDNPKELKCKPTTKG